MGTVYAKEKTTITHSEALDSGVTKEQKTINLQNVKARVDKVNVEGLVRTRDDIIRRTIQDLFLVSNFEEVIKQAHKVRGKLESLGCFRSIAIHIDTSRGPSATPNGYEVTYFVRELNRLKGGVNTMVGGDNEGSLVISAQGPNLFGGAERLHAEYSYGSRRSRTFNVGFYKPFFLDLDVAFSANIFQQEAEWPSSGYKIIDRGSSLDLSFFSLNKLKHNVQWEASWRELGVNRYASFKVREDVGHTLKSSLRHIISLDYRDSPIFPNYGMFLQCTSEFAGLGGNVGFLKHEVQLQQNIEVFPDTVMQGALSGGWMKRVDDSKNIFICDRFFLGGPLSLRGFNNRGVGPFNDGSFIGGMMYWSGALHLYSPLPFRPRAGGLGDYIRTHIFINAGNLGDFNFGDKNWLQEIKATTRMAYGAGIAMRIGQMARIELNYVIPVYFQETDSTSKGVQFGIGLHFL
ncbi:sorting and assembly machinery component 50 homolog [Lycorma delicatula]|uniref:sorting and assembly machinery component 50 homolog n=1 Tax=Lycorma delicatula TaxID=130591 RepID=UPI003F50FAE2